MVDWIDENIYIKNCKLMHRSGTQCDNWNFSFHISSDFKFEGFLPNIVCGVGKCFDNVMGMSYDNFKYISRKYGNLDKYIEKYFIGSNFRITRTIDRLRTINLPEGNQLTFINWLGLQPNFEIETLLNDLLGNIDCIQMQTFSVLDIDVEYCLSKGTTDYMLLY